MKYYVSLTTEVCKNEVEELMSLSVLFVYCAIGSVLHCSSWLLYLLDCSVYTNTSYVLITCLYFNCVLQCSSNVLLFTILQ